MIVFDRRYESVQQVVSEVPSYSMNGRFLLDYPDNIELEEENLVFTGIYGLVTEIIPNKILELYPSYDSVIYEPLLDSSLTFDNSVYFPRDFGFQRTRNKSGTTPNCASLLKTSDVGWYGVGITHEIDITAETSDGLGRETFMVYWRFVTKSFTQDKTPTIHDPSNEGASVTYTEVSNPSLYSVYISGDNGSTYQEVQNLSPYSFSSRVSSIRLAFVNKTTSDDVFLLSYALLF
jgi:hypothetical protein